MKIILSSYSENFILLFQFKFADVINVSMLLPNYTDQSQIRRFLVEELELGPLVTQANLVNDTLLVERKEDGVFQERKL